MEDFKKYFKFPLKRQRMKVFTDDGDMAFDFMFKGMDLGAKNRLILDDDYRDRIVAQLNNPTQDTFMGKFPNITYNDGWVYLNGQEIIFVKGWGRLTGQGGFKLSSEKAIKIQNKFGEYIVKCLQNN